MTSLHSNLGLLLIMQSQPRLSLHSKLNQVCSPSSQWRVGGLNKKARFMFLACKISEAKCYKKTMIVRVQAILVKTRLSNWLDKHFGGPIYIEMSISMSNSVLNVKLSKLKEVKPQAYFNLYRFLNPIGKVCQWILLLGYLEPSVKKILS